MSSQHTGRNLQKKAELAVNKQVTAQAVSKTVRGPPGILHLYLYYSKRKIGESQQKEVVNGGRNELFLAR